MAGNMSIEEVADWVEQIGFPDYKKCFSDNFIDGKKLETVNASKLPKLGVTDFEDIKKITNRIQALCESVKPDWGRSVADVEWTPRNSAEACTSGYGQEAGVSAEYQPKPRWQQMKEEQEAFNLELSHGGN